MPKSFKEYVQEVRESGIPEVTSEDLARKRENNEDFVLIDVRDPEEWEKGTIPGAVTLSKGKLELKIGEIVEDPDKEIICQCGGGSRSLLAAKSLREMGYKNVASLAGGYKGWQEYSGKG